MPWLVHCEAIGPGQLRHLPRVSFLYSTLVTFLKLLDRLKALVAAARMGHAAPAGATVTELLGTPEGPDYGL
jgi:hypothetical protein